MTINSNFSEKETKLSRNGWCQTISQALRPSNLLKVTTACLALFACIPSIQALSPPVTENAKDLTSYNIVAMPNTRPTIVTDNANGICNEEILEDDWENL